MMAEMVDRGEEKIARPPGKMSWSITNSDIEVPKEYNDGKKNIRHSRRGNDPRKSSPVHRKQKSSKLSWDSTAALSSPPSSFTVTSIKQCYELQLVRDLEVAHAEGQTSTAWLQNNSLLAQGLTLKEVLKEGIPVKPPVNSSVEFPNAIQHLKFYSDMLDEFETKLKRSIDICQERIQWLLRDSRRTCGLITAQSPCILLDVSDTNCGFGRLELLQDSLKQLITEQLSKKEKLYISSFGTYVHPLWTTVRAVNCRIVDEALHWVDCLRPSGGCNVMAAVQQLLKWKEFDCIVLILGNCTDQNPQVIIDYVLEELVGRTTTFHTVAYNCNITATNMFLKELSDVTGGRYHCYSAINEDEIMTGTDLTMLAEEIRLAGVVLTKIADIREGSMVDNRAVSVVKQPSLEIMKIPDGKESIDNTLDLDFVSLSVEKSSFPARTSEEWLLQHSLKAKGLTLYQVMAPNAFSYVNGYVSSINKVVASQIHHRSMVQLQWHDGSVKNVHVDPVQLFNYQHHLETSLQLYRRRVEWLTKGSRKIFGSIVEKRVVILLDTSFAMTGDLIRLHNDVRKLLEQQLSNKTSYNIICFGRSAKPFRPAMIEPTAENLNSTWRWIIQQNCDGTRKMMDAFRIATENEEELKHGIEVDGVYLIISGIPDEPKDAACSYVQESFAGKETVLHCIFYEPIEFDALALGGRYADTQTTVSYLKDLTHSVHGRFHWLKGDDIIESDDIRNINDEMAKTQNYRRKAEMLLEAIGRQRNTTEESTEAMDSIQLVPRPPTSNKRSIGPPRQTALSQARINGVRPHSAVISSESSPKAKGRPRSAISSQSGSPFPATWKPNTISSSSNIIPAVQSDKPVKDSRKKHSEASIKPTQQVFYTEVGNETGSVFRSSPAVSNPNKKSVHINSSSRIPDKEESCTTKEWLHRYSLAKLKLDLNAIVNTTDCAHSKGKVSALVKSGPAKYCEIFPSVTIKGVTKHLHLQHQDLEEYEDKLEKVMKRYVKRLQWLLTGSRKVFGTLTEKNLTLLVDVSGSMVTSMEELIREIRELFWEQIFENKLNFNVIKFSTEAVSWKSHLTDSRKENCEDACSWIADFEAYGGTCTLDALKMAFDDDKIEGIYLLTDGKPDNSTSSVLREVATLHALKKVRVHTISFNCDDSIANRFLQLLAAQTGGRYHRFQGHVDGHLVAHKILTEGFTEDDPGNIPLFEGDDLKRIAKEIALCRQYLLQARTYRALYTRKSSTGKIDEGITTITKKRLSVNNLPEQRTLVT